MLCALQQDAELQTVSEWKFKKIFNNYNEAADRFVISKDTLLDIL